MFDFEVESFEKERDMTDNDIIGNANDRVRNIRDYFVFDLNAMHTSIILPKITIAQFEFKPMMFHMLQAIG